VTFRLVVTRKNEEDSRSTEQKSKEPSKTYIDHVFLEGGKIIQLPPTEVVASGGRWGSVGQDQQSCGHKMKLHSSVGQNSIQSRRSFDEGMASGGGSESLCDMRCEIDRCGKEGTK